MIRSNHEIQNHWRAIDSLSQDESSLLLEFAVERGAPCRTGSSFGLSGTNIGIGLGLTFLFPLSTPKPPPTRNAIQSNHNHQLPFRHPLSLMMILLLTPHSSPLTNCHGRLALPPRMCEKCRHGSRPKKPKKLPLRL